MGTTCTALAVRDGKAWLAHVGDSRAYLLRAAKLKQLSEDQTLVRKLVKDGAMTEEEAKRSDNSNVLLQAMGTLPQIKPELWDEGLILAPDDVLVLCSDGLHGLVPDDRIADIAGRLPPLEACQELIAQALRAGGHDNVSIGVFHAVSAAPARDSAEPQGGTTRRIAAAGSTSGSSEAAGQTTRQIPTFERQP